jgi:hypothetical protein
MKLRSLGFTLALFIAMAGSASADPKSTAEAIDKAVTVWMSAQQVQSAAVAVSFHGEVAGLVRPRRLDGAGAASARTSPKRSRRSASPS